MRVHVESEKIEVGRELAEEIDILIQTKIVIVEPVWFSGEKDKHLIVLEPRRDEGEEAVIVEQMGWTDGRRSVVEGQHLLIEVVVGGGPEMTAPRLVERGDSLVLVPEEA